jgi:DNA-binding CsgD family transcriptional regulator
VRQHELSLIAEVLRDIHKGEPAGIGFRGDVGTGKSWLIDAAVHTAASEDVLVLRQDGASEDADLDFGALDSMFRPVAALLSETGEGSQLLDALSQRDKTDPLTVRVALFKLLCLLAEDRPVLLCIDDACQLDSASADAIGFAMRQFGADAVGVVAAWSGTTPWSSLPRCELEAVEIDDLSHLLEKLGTSPNPAAACANLAQGNPGVAVALSEALTEGQRNGTAAFPPMPRATTLLVQRSQELLASYPREVRRLLAVVAADHRGHAFTIGKALRRLGVPASAWRDAEAIGAINIDEERVHFTDPWIRPSAYHAVAASSRRAAHRALAEAYGGEHQATDRARHLMAAADGPNDTVAEALAVVATELGSNGSRAAAASTFDRASAIAASDSVRGCLLLRAAEQWITVHDLSKAEAAALRVRPSTTHELLAVVRLIEMISGPQEGLRRLMILAEPTDRYDERLVIGCRRALVAAIDVSFSWEPAVRLTSSSQASTGTVSRRLSQMAEDGLHADVLSEAADSVSVPSLLAAAAAARHPAQFRRSRELLVIAEALMTPSCVLWAAEAAILHADLDVLAGRFNDALARLDAAEPVLRNASHARPLTIAGWLRDRIKTAMGESSAAPSHVWPNSGEVWRLRRLAATGSALLVADQAAEKGLPIESAEARIAAAEECAKVGDFDQANELADIADIVLGRYGVRCWAQRLATIRGQQASQGYQRSIDQLSQSELRVAEAVTAGLTNRQAAAELFISIKTVDFHLQQIYRKLGLRSRTGLAVLITSGSNTARLEDHT